MSNNFSKDMFDLANEVSNQAILQRCKAIKDSFKDTCYTLRGKSLSFNGTKYKYNDFFNLTVDSSTYKITNIHSSSGVDVLSFAVFGMCISLSHVGVILPLIMQERGGYDSRMFLIALADFIEDRFPNGVDFRENIKEIDRVKTRYSNYTMDKVSLDECLEFSKTSNLNSMFFARTFGNSSVIPDSCLLTRILPKLMCFALRDDAIKYFTEMFVAFRELIWLGALTHINENMHGEDNWIHNLAGAFDIGDDRKLTNILNLSVRIALALVSDLHNEDLSLVEFTENVEDLLLKDLGTDLITDYITSGNVDNFIQSVYHDEFIRVSVNSIIHGNCDDNYKSVDILYSWLYCIHLRAGYFAGLGIDTLTFFKDSCFEYLDESVWHDFLIKDIFYDFIEKGMTITNQQLKESKDKYYTLSKRYDSANDTIKNLRKQNEELTNQLKESIDSNAQVTKLNYELEIQKAKYSELSLQVEELKLKLQDQTNAVNELLTSLQCESEETQSTGTSTEEMLEMLNGFRFCFVGGRVEMTDKLNALGWYNFIQANNTADVSRVDSYDFIVSMTSFLSHSIFFTAINRLGTDRSKHMYFNGTNLNNLMKSCYDFVMKYFEIDKK